MGGQQRWGRSVDIRDGGVLGVESQSSRTGSQIVPYKIEYPTDVDFKGVPPRIRVLLLERCFHTGGQKFSSVQFNSVKKKGLVWCREKKGDGVRLVRVVLTALTLSQNGYEAGVGNKDVEFPKAFQHLLYG
jgi:hypothetical protein